MADHRLQDVHGVNPARHINLHGPGACAIDVPRRTSHVILAYVDQDVFDRGLALPIRCHALIVPHHSHQDNQNMTIKSAVVFRYPASQDLSGLEQALSGMPLKPVGPQEMTSHGFLPVLENESDQMLREVSGIISFRAAKQERVLPSAVVNTLLADRISKIKQAEGREPRGKAKKALKEEIILELLPKAFVRQSSLLGYFDTTRHLLVVGTGSVSAAEAIGSMIRQAVGSFPALPVTYKTPLSDQMTSWLQDESAVPEKWLVGDNCHLADPAEKKISVRCSGLDLSSEEVLAHVEQGMKVKSVALSFDGRLGFSLSEDGVIKSIKLLEGVEPEPSDSPEADYDASILLLAAELGALLDDASAQLGWADLEDEG